MRAMAKAASRFALSVARLMREAVPAGAEAERHVQLFQALLERVGV